MTNFRVLLSAVFVLTFALCQPVMVFADDGEVEAAKQLILEVNINSASVVELAEKLDGIGEARAQLIIEYREKHGPFTSIDQLLNVKGIGATTLKKNKERIRL
ncbi:hypothetical protein Misp06_03340 [Microbulbifer sp. NBRC 101763]|uniref:ComEA family DNA-binding protein n=1 Tax=Microbulbifer sp. NBRC 101763 TaxID=1113820 RepID=UPI0030B63669